MGYRRSKNDALWRRHVRSLAALRERAGIPLWMMEDLGVWAHFVQSGYCSDLTRNWFLSTAQMSLDRRDALIDLLLADKCSWEEIVTCIPFGLLPPHRQEKCRQLLGHSCDPIDDSTP